MSKNFVAARDALEVWDNLKDTVNARSAFTRDNHINHEDYGFITPTIIVGKLSELSVDELVNILQGSPAVIWNLSGRPLTAESKGKLNNQIIDASWVCPGQSETPSIESILAQCRSIKSWLDIRHDNIAFVHCSNGRTRSGVLVACLLKYIGAFDRACDAFDFFCRTRNLTGADVEELPTSYHILFENIDKTVDSSGYPNRFPVHLKYIAISGLPADEVPIIEVRDMQGLVFNSHQCLESSRPTWSSEYGDGSFQVSHDILGDFAITCRFGGSFAMVKDKTTLIFTYQNNTAFLPCEVVELKQNNMEFNIAYSSSLEDELFTVHLMFEETVQGLPEDDDRLSPGGAFGRSNFVLPSYICPVEQADLAFEKGLEQLCKDHFVNVDPSNVEALENSGYPDKFIKSALKLSNNSMEKAAELIQKMMARDIDLKGDSETKDSVTAVPFSTSSTISRSYSATGKELQQQAHTLLTSKRLDVDPFTGLNTLITDGDQDIESLSEDDEEEEDGQILDPDGEDLESLVSDIEPNAVCFTCLKDERARRNQLVPCSACHREFHTFCLGRRAVPFSLKTTKERQNREKFILKNYRFWRCNQCCTLDTPDGSLDGGSIEKPSTLDASSNDSENDPWSDPWEMPGDDPEQEEEQELEEETSSQPSSVDYANLSRTESSFFIKDKDSPPKIFAQTMPSTMSPPSANVKTSPYQSARTSSPSRIPRLSLPTADTRQPSPTRNTRTSPRTTSPTRNSQQSSPIGSHPSSPHSKSKTLPSAGSSMTPLRRISLSEAARPRNSGKSNSRFLLPDPESAPYSGSTWMFKSKTPRAPKARPQSVGQSRVPTKHDQTAALMGLLSASGLTMDMLMAMDEETQRETLIAAATIRNSSRLTDTERLQLRNGQAIAEEDELASSRVRFSLPVSPVKEGEETKEEITPPKQPFDHKDALKKLQRRSAEELENKMISETEAADSKKPAPRVKSTRKVPSVRVEQPPNKLERLSSMKLDHPPRAERMSSVRFEQSPVKADPVRRVHHEPVHVPTKVQVQAPATVSQESVDPRKAMMMMLAKRGGSEPAAEVTTIEASEPAVDPRKAMMMMLAKKAGGGDGEVSAPPPKDPRNAMMAMLAKRGGGGDAEPSTETKAASTASGGGGNVTVQLKDCRKYGKYFKMLKVGLPPPAVCQKMMSDGAVTSYDEGQKLLDLGGDGNSPELQPNQQKGSETAGDPRMAMMAMLAKRGGGGESSSGEGGEGGGGGGADIVRLKDCHKYGKYFKMLKVGLPPPAVVQKMMSDGVVSTFDGGKAILDLGGDGVSPESDAMSESVSALSSEKTTTTQVALKDHPSYTKYFKMLKVGLDKDNVRFKMEQDGISAEILDRDPNTLISIDEISAGDGKDDEVVPLSYHPSYGKYFRMLSVRLPKDAIKAKMQQDGLNPDFLDRSPLELIPRGPLHSNSISEQKAMREASEADGVSLLNHPVYGKFFKMLKVGLPVEAVKAKMAQEGVDPDYLDRDSSEIVPTGVGKKEKSSSGRVKSQRVKSQRIKSVHTALTALGAGAQGGPKVRKKKLYWKALDDSKVGGDSLWAEKDDDIALDEAEFNLLFVETDESVAKKAAKDGEKKPSALEEAQNSRKRVNLIDAKRAQNAGIALARIKMPFAEVKERITLMKDDAFTTDQLLYLLEYLPSDEEAYVISAYKGDPELLGQAEKYMKEMSGFDSGAKHIQAMIYKQQFKTRVVECAEIISAIENACDDVKMSVGLKKVLKTILKVGNQMNDGRKHLGFTLDSLLKLQSAKAFDKKTSILQYVITLIHRNDEKCLQFPKELSHCAEASRLTLDSACQEQIALRRGLEASLRVVSECLHKDATSTVLNAMSVMTSFLSEAKQSLEDLSCKIDNIKSKFSNVLAYFGEEDTMSSQDFFSTLSAFILEFIVARDNLERILRMEHMRAMREKDMAERQRLKELSQGTSDQSGLSREERDRRATV